MLTNQEIKINEKKKMCPGFRALLIVSLLGYSLCSAVSAAQSDGYGTTLKSFALEKEKQAQSLASSDGDALPQEFQPFFSAIQDGHWEAASNNYSEIKFWVTTSSIYHKSWWQPVLETFGAEEQFRCQSEKYFTVYANDIIQSIPSGSIYFGGTDPARFIITAAQKSQIAGDPFFTLTQNALADDTYRDYLRSMYGGKIYIPSKQDAQKCFNVYWADVRDRMQKGQLQPGEQVTTDPATGKMQITGQIGVMAVNALIARVTFDHNTGREFYIQESFPLAWMNPYLEPHGLIFRLNREPLAELSDDIVRRDHDYWVKTVSPMIGDWLNNTTSVQDVSAFAEKVFHRHDFAGFTGDKDFIQNADAQRMFSKERSSIAGLYAWRARNAAGAAERQRMYNEADFAFRQSLALCPVLPETVFRYVEFLMQTNRVDDALIAARTSLSLEPTNETVSILITNLEQFKKRSASMPQTQSQLHEMELKARAAPSDYTNIFTLAGYYVQMQQTNRAAELLEQTISHQNVPPDALRGAAQFFAQINDFSNLETTLKKMTFATPNSAETWYDLARLQARLEEDDEAIKNLGNAIKLSDQRLQTNSSALDLRAVARTSADFNSIRNRADFKTLISP